MRAMISVREAQARILAQIDRVAPPEVIPLGSALGRVLTIPLLRRLPHKIENSRRAGGALTSEVRDTSLAAALTGSPP